MPMKTGAGGELQEYNESTGRYGGGNSDYTGKGTEMRVNTSYSEIVKDTAPLDMDALQNYKVPKDPVVRKPQDAQKWAKYDADYERYKTEEPTITRDVDDISRETGLPFIGRDFRLKSKGSYDRKVNDKRLYSEYKPLGDTVRYTFEHKLKNAPEDIRKTLAKFEEKGYNIIAVDNKWKDDDAYNGINVDIVSPNGVPMEVQFMTLNNHDTKEQMHRYYEIARDNRTPANIRALAEKKMYEIAKMWEYPDRITEV